MANDSSLVNFGDLAKPVTKLVTKISNAVEGSAKPWQIRRVRCSPSRRYGYEGSGRERGCDH